MGMFSRLFQSISYIYIHHPEIILINDQLNYKKKQKKNCYVIKFKKQFDMMFAKQRRYTAIIAQPYKDPV